MNNPEVDPVYERLRFPYNFIDAFFGNYHTEPECSIKLPMEKITDKEELSKAIETRHCFPNFLRIINRQSCFITVMD